MNIQSHINQGQLLLEKLGVSVMWRVNVGFVHINQDLI